MENSTVKSGNERGSAFCCKQDIRGGASDEAHRRKTMWTTLPDFSLTEPTHVTMKLHEWDFLSDICKQANPEWFPVRIRTSNTRKVLCTITQPAWRTSQIHERRGIQNMKRHLFGLLQRSRLDRLSWQTASTLNQKDCYQSSVVLIRDKTVFAREIGHQDTAQISQSGKPGQLVSCMFLTGLQKH